MFQLVIEMGAFLSSFTNGKEETENSIENVPVEPVPEAETVHLIESIPVETPVLSSTEPIPVVNNSECPPPDCPCPPPDCPCPSPSPVVSDIDTTPSSVEEMTETVSSPVPTLIIEVPGSQSSSSVSSLTS